MEQDDQGVSVEGVSVERVDDHRLKVTIDGEPIDVTVRTEYSMHHHFGRFSTLEQLVEVVRRQREEGGHEPHEPHEGHEGHERQADG